MAEAKVQRGWGGRWRLIYQEVAVIAERVDLARPANCIMGLKPRRKSHRQEETTGRKK
jgi:hypothetical protein